MFRKVLRIAVTRWTGFGAFGIGVVVASAVWLLVVPLVSLTPGQAGARRAEPTLPPPTAALREMRLMQVSWHDCTAAAEEIEVKAPAVPAGPRSVVTFAAPAGAHVRTGTVLLRVADRPVAAVVTGAIFYRDMRVGDRGPDAEAFMRAMSASRMISASGSTITSEAVRAWASAVGGDSPNDRIPWRSLVAVPAGSSVASVTAGPGDDVRSGQSALVVAANRGAFDCEVPDPNPMWEPKRFKLELNGRSVPIMSLKFRPRTQEREGSIRVYAPKARAGDARLQILQSGSPAPVLAAPLSAIAVGSSAQPTVSVYRETGIQKVRIRLGATSAGWVGVVGKGLAVGTRVVLTGSETVRSDVGGGK